MMSPRIKVALATFLLVITCSFFPGITQVERSFYDLRMDIWQNINNQLLDNNIRLISVNDTSIATNWTDEDLLAVIEELERRGAVVVVCGQREVFSKPESIERIPESTLTPDAEALLREDSDLEVQDPDGLVRKLPAGHPADRLARQIVERLKLSPFEPDQGTLNILFKPRRAVLQQVSSDTVTESLEPVPIYRFVENLGELPDSLRGTVYLIGKYVPGQSVEMISTPFGEMHSMQLVALLVNTYTDGWNLFRWSKWQSLTVSFAVTLLFCLMFSGRRPGWVLSAGALGCLGSLWIALTMLPRGLDGEFFRVPFGIFLATLILLVIEGIRSQRALAQFGGREDAELTGEETEASILFTILPDHLIEMEKRHDPNLLAARRQYNNVIQEVCQLYNGRVLDYQGDAQMMGFGLTTDDYPHHPIEASAAALAIVEKVEELKDVWQVPLEKVRVHVGVCTGPVALGHVGSEEKQDIAAIGDTSNTAARLMGAAMKQKVGVLLSKPTFEAAQEWVTGKSLPAVELKGKSKPVPIFEALRVSDAWQEANDERARARGPQGGTFELASAHTRSLLPTFLMAFLVFFFMLKFEPRVLWAVDQKIYDWRLRTVYSVEADDRIVLVGIDEESMRVLGPYPWPRPIYAHVIDTLQDSGYKGLFLDILFKTSKENDELLADAVMADERVVLGAALQTEGRKIYQPQLMNALDVDTLRKRHQLGLLHKREDSDETLRWAILGAETDAGEAYPTAAVAMLLKPGQRFSLDPFMIGDRRIPVSRSEDAPNELLIRFGPSTTRGQRPDPGSYKYYHFWQLVTGEEEVLRELRGKYILVGEASTAGAHVDRDRILTPVGRIKGVEGHARTLDTLLNDDYLVKLSRGLELAWMTLLVVMTVYLMTFRRRTLRVLPRLGLLLGLHLVVNEALFAAGYVADVTPPAVMMFAIACTVMFGRYLLTLRALSRFVPAEVVDEIIYGHGPSDRRMTATVLLTDIRGYTTLSETRTAVQMLEILNEYHRRTVACYERHGGQALTYQGDAQIVIFGVFGNRPEPAVDAVEAALELQEICTQLRKEWGIERKEDFDVGAGLCTGEVEVGVLGSGNQRQYSVIGETVRTTHKVQGMSDELQAPVILDEATYLFTGGLVVADDLGLVQPKGLDRKVRLYRARATRDLPGGPTGIQRWLRRQLGKY